MHGTGNILCNIMDTMGVDVLLAEDTSGSNVAFGEIEYSSPLHFETLVASVFLDFFFFFFFFFRLGRPCG